MSTLADYGIYPRRPGAGWRLGWQGTSCPECAETKHRPNDDALGVRVFDDGGACWSCRRCGWKGHILPDRSERVGPPPAARNLARLIAYARARGWRATAPAGRLLLLHPATGAMIALGLERGE